MGICENYTTGPPLRVAIGCYVGALQFVVNDRADMGVQKIAKVGYGTPCGVLSCCLYICFA